MSTSINRLRSVWPSWEQQGAHARAQQLQRWLRQLPADTALLGQWLLDQRLPLAAASQTLPSYTGEHDTLRWRGRGIVVVVPDPQDPVLSCGQLAAVLLAGNTALCTSALAGLPGLAPWALPAVDSHDGPGLLQFPELVGVICASTAPQINDWAHAVTIAGAPLREFLVVDRAALLAENTLQRLMWEQTVTTNTTALGGNPGLLQGA